MKHTIFPSIIYDYTSLFLFFNGQRCMGANGEVIGGALSFVYSSTIVETLSLLR